MCMLFTRIYNHKCTINCQIDEREIERDGTLNRMCLSMANNCRLCPRTSKAPTIPVLHSHQPSNLFLFLFRRMEMKNVFARTDDFNSKRFFHFQTLRAIYEFCVPRSESSDFWKFISIYFICGFFFVGDD